MKRILFITETLDTYSGWGTYSKELTNELKNSGFDIVVECIKGPLKFKRNFFLSWWYALKFYFKYRNKNINLIHCAVEPYAFISFLLAKLMKVPYVINLVGTYAILFFPHKVYGKLQYMAYKNASALIAISHHTKRRVEEFYNKSEILVAPLGHNQVISKTGRVLSNRPVILSVGGLKRRKGIHLVIEALGKIRDKVPVFSYYVVGSGQDENYLSGLKESVIRLGLQENVIITGRLSEKELQNMYAKADIFVLTPVSEGLHFEGFGLVYLEANARGIPAIGMMGNGGEDAIGNGTSGYLAEEGDISDLGEKISSLLNDSNAYQKLSLGSIKWAEKMQWKNQVKAYSNVYNNLLND